MFDSESAVSFVIQQESRLISGFLVVLEEEEEEPSHGSHQHAEIDRNLSSF